MLKGFAPLAVIAITFVASAAAEPASTNVTLKAGQMVGVVSGAAEDLLRRRRCRVAVQPHVGHRLGLVRLCNFETAVEFLEHRRKVIVLSLFGASWLACLLLFRLIV